MEMNVSGTYQARIRKGTYASFNTAELERILKSEPNLSIRFVLKDSERISFACDTKTILNLRKKIGDLCDIEQVWVRY